MSESRNTQIVKDAYDAFKRGDIDSILAVLDDAVVWDAVKGAEGVMATAGTRRGRAEVGKFFSQVASTITFEAFEPREFVAQGDTVVAIGDYRGKATETGRPFSADWAMVFTIENGRIVRFREFTDSAALVRAFGKTSGAPA